MGFMLQMSYSSNTNMFVESFHKVLKIIYLHHKRNQRVDTLVVTLLKISRDEALGCLMKLENGWITHQTSEINLRHKCAEKMIMDNAYSILTVEQLRYGMDSAVSIRPKCYLHNQATI